MDAFKRCFIATMKQRRGRRLVSSGIMVQSLDVLADGLVLIESTQVRAIAAVGAERRYRSCYDGGNISDKPTDPALAASTRIQYMQAGTKRACAGTRRGKARISTRYSLVDLAV
eukprot:2485125-Rhodomonas_salina.1